jgi:hypothetical protein
VLASARQVLRTTFEASSVKQEIFWINLWQRGSPEAPLPVAGAKALDKWARELVTTAYADEPSAFIDGYGFITSPLGAKVQPWHIDYNMDQSTIWIPLTRLTTQNCLQYAVLPPHTPPDVLRNAFADVNIVDLDGLVSACDYVSVRQLLVPPYTVIKMDFSTLHHGVANTGDEARTMFWISVSRKADTRPLEQTAVTFQDDPVAEEKRQRTAKY